MSMGRLMRWAHDAVTRTGIPDLVGGAILLAAVWAVYLPAVKGDFLWDDNKYVTGNPLLTAPDGLGRIWFSLDSPSQYFPLTYTVFRLERSLWGLNPAGYHAVNILLHGLNALLLWSILHRLRIPGAWLASALFAFHPVQVESVAWITELKNVLCGFFSLLSLRAWLDVGDDDPMRSRRGLLLAFIFYVPALLSKTTAVTLPAAFMVVSWLREGRLGKRRLAQVSPFAALGLGMGLLAVWWERYHQGATGPDFSFSPVERLLIAGRAFWTHLLALIRPARLAFSYPRWPIDAGDPAAYLWPAAAVAAGILVWRARRRWGRGPAAAFFLYAATLAPLLGFISLYTFRYAFVADHYQYLACAGPLALLAAGLAGRSGSRREAAWLRPAAGLLLVILLAALSRRQAGFYRDAETLWKGVLSRYPASWLARNNLGLVYEGRGRMAAAMEEYREAIRLNPRVPEAHTNLGNALAAQGEAARAMEEYRRALETDPGYARAHYDLALLLQGMGREEEARAHYREAVRLVPRWVEARVNLAALLERAGEAREALAHYREALRWDPASAAALERLASLLAGQGRDEEAVEAYGELVRLQPGNAQARNNLGSLLARRGDLDRAENQLREAVRLNPSSDAAHFNLGLVLASRGRRQEAASAFEAALGLKPDHEGARRALEDLLQRSQ